MKTGLIPGLERAQLPLDFAPRRSRLLLVTSDRGIEVAKIFKVLDSLTKMPHFGVEAAESQALRVGRR